MFSRLFGAQRLKCPHCLHDLRLAHQGDPCGECGAVPPPLYVREARELVPLAVQTIGWSGHGKSVFLSSLVMLLTRLQVIWPTYTWSAGSDETQLAVEQVNGQVASGNLPPPTPLGSDTPCLLLLRGMDRWGGRAVVYRDSAGELFNSMSIPVEQVPFLLKAETLFLITSPVDLAESRERTPDLLLNGLLTAFERHRVDLARSRRRLVVVLTKADLVPDLPDVLRDYLATDRFWRTLVSGTPGWRFDEPAIGRYLEGMAGMDRELRKWVQTEPEFRNLVGMAESRKLDLRFCLVSATGGPVRDQRLENEWDPRRVLDPFLWALDFEAVRFRVASTARQPTVGRRFEVRSRS